MKKQPFSRYIIFFFVLALSMIVIGLVWTGKTFSHFDDLVIAHGDHDQLLCSVRVTALYLLVSGSITGIGICILVILFLHMIRKTSRIQNDADALRKKNEAIERVNQQTREHAHHQRLQTIGTLTASIAHEFNNLLTPIMGYSMMALEKLPAGEDELYDGILEIYQASQKAKNIISRLSDLSRKNSSTTFRPLSIDDLVKKTLDVAVPAKPGNVEIQLDLNCWDQRIRANEIQINQLLLNLILNSFHAMEAIGGVLTICTSFDDKNIWIRVADTGCGIKKDILPHIFEPFFTTKDTGKGTGLGLAIVAQVVEDHQGSINVDSKIGKGTSMIVRLPRIC